MSEKARITRLPGWHKADMYHCLVNKCYLYGYQMNCALSIRLPGE